MKKYLIQGVHFFLLFAFMVSNSPLYAAEKGGAPQKPIVIQDKEVRDNYGRTPLMQAAEKGEVEKVKRLLTQEANIHAVDNSGRTPLMYAGDISFFPIPPELWQKKLTIAQLLLDAGADVNAQYKEERVMEGATALITAARSGNVELVKLLIKKGAEVNAQDRSRGWTALKWAQIRNLNEVAKILTEAGARDLPPPPTPRPTAPVTTPTPQKPIAVKPVQDKTVIRDTFGNPVPSFTTQKKQEITGEMKRLKIELQKLVEIGKNIDKGIKVPVGYFMLTLEGIMLIMLEIVQLLIHSINIPGQYYLYRLTRYIPTQVGSGLVGIFSLDPSVGIPVDIKLDEAALQKKFDSYAQSKAFKRLMNVASKLIINSHKYVLKPGWVTLSLLLIIFINFMGILAGIQYSILKYGSRILSYTLWELSIGLTELLGIKAKERPERISQYKSWGLPAPPSRETTPIWKFE